MQEAIRLALESVPSGGGPFGAVIVQNEQIIGRGSNCVVIHNDPTAHAEVNAIRDACRHLRTFQLPECDLYTSCEPCPMCLSAIYWARLRKVFFACTRKDAATAGFDDELIFQEVSLPMEKRALEMRQLLREQAAETFKAWLNKPDKIRY